MKPKSQTKRRTGRRTFLGGAFAAAGGSLVAGAGNGSSAEPSKSPNVKITRLAPKDAPAADLGYSPGILAEGKRLVVVSGQGPENLKADMEIQIRQTFQRIGRVLEAAGASFENVVMVRSYFVHLARDLAAFRKVRREFLRKPYPASTAVGVTELAIPGLEIEIEAVAVL